MSDQQNPVTRYPQPPFTPQPQSFPGLSAKMTPEPDYGERSYKGSGKLSGKVALITGADSGIGRAVAVAYALEGADLALSFLEEESEDAEAAARFVRETGRRVLLLPGDIADPAVCRSLVEKTLAEFGRLDILVNNAAFQQTHQSLEEIPDEEWRRTFDVNIHAMFYITKTALPHLKPGSSVINTSSVNSKHPMPSLIPYSATKASIANFTISLAQGVAEKGIRVNAVLPGPIWTPFIVTGMEPEQQKSFGSQAPIGRPGQPAELAGAYVYLASDENSYTTGALLPVHGGMAIY
ncbi:SDR family oxidoreductase [Rhizosaccharibacter radicis]|uniref:SDR family oxidoreductase n=1 Tax=Rhizosaccharibacter radicis TaxID=2782605 RepID=A0ABT1VTV1_9PROT|nr:SDR family oxidoreductase [Acetobacteraceae bacterium KSS12]